MAQVTAGRVRVCVFAKPPRAGLVKTRLAADLGPEGAARLARAFFDDTWAAVGALDWADAVLATTDVQAPEWTDPPGMALWPQGDGHLGDRMERVLSRALDTHVAAIAIGTDSPGLPPDTLNDARRALAHHDAVIGPSEDGGFYLIGLRRCPEGLFLGVPWSADDTCARTLQRLGALNLSVAVLPSWFDVDRPGDLQRLRSMRDVLEHEAPATARVLAELYPDVQSEAATA